jgi:hypothetical protein
VVSERIAGTATPGSSSPAVTGSVATTTARAASSPSSVATAPGRTARTRTPSRSTPSGSAAASCAGSAPMPCAGTTIVPSAKLRHTSRTNAAEVSSSRSPSTPDRNGRRNRSTAGPVSPAAARSAAAERSISPAVRCGGVASTRAVHATSLALSSTGSRASVADDQASEGRRTGLANTCSAPSVPRIAAPGSNARRSSASRSATARSAG